MMHNNPPVLQMQTIPYYAKAFCDFFVNFAQYLNNNTKLIFAQPLAWFGYHSNVPYGFKQDVKQRRHKRSITVSRHGTAAHHNYP